MIMGNCQWKWEKSKGQWKKDQGSGDKRQG